MKFSSAAMGLCLAASAAMASPLSVEKRQQDVTVVGSIDASIAELLTIIPQAEAAIESAVNALLNTSASVEAAVIIAAEATIKTNLASIVTALNDSATAFLRATGGTAGAVAAIAANLTQSEINMLERDIIIIKNIVAGLGVTVSGTASLGAAVTAAISSELGALEAVIAPFTTPLTVLVDAVADAAATVKVTVTGVENAVGGLMSIAGGLIKSIGLHLHLKE